MYLVHIYDRNKNLLYGGPVMGTVAILDDGTEKFLSHPGEDCLTPPPGIVGSAVTKRPTKPFVKRHYCG